MARVRRERFVAESLALYILVLCITVGNLYFKVSVIDLIVTGGVEDDSIIYWASELFLILCTFLTYKSYQRSKLLLTSSESRVMNVGKEKNEHNSASTFMGDSDCGE